MSMDVKQALDLCVVEGNVVKLTSQQLDRPVYEGVKKALEGIGGKWKGGKVGGFVFPHDPSELLADVQGGKKRNLKKEFQFFPTPSALADRLVQLAEPRAGMSILEPSAGEGAIVKAIHKAIPNHNVYVCEINPTQILMLTAMDLVIVVGTDFLEMEYLDERDDTYDRIIGNPPFSGNQDIEHIMHMYQLLKKGGRLTSLASCHWVESSNKKETEFRAWLKKVGAIIHDVPAGAFKESGTPIATKIIVIDR